MKGTLKNGFEFDVDEQTLDDMELIDAMAEAQDENPAKFSTVIIKLLGEEQRDRLYDHIRDKKTGRVTIQATTDAVVEIFEKLGEQGKN